MSTNETLQDQPQPETWQDRLVREYTDLQDKVAKLGAFLDKVEDGTQKLDPVTRSLMVAQHGLMTAYIAILFVRMNARVVEVPQEKAP